MTIVISFDEEMKNPTTLFVMEDEAAIAEHAEKFCQANNLEYDPRFQRAEVVDQGRTFVWRWTYPREIYGIWKGPKPGKWVWSFAGVELTRVEFHTCIIPDDLWYLFMRMRGIPLSRVQSH